MGADVKYHSPWIELSPNRAWNARKGSIKFVPLLTLAQIDMKTEAVYVQIGELIKLLNIQRLETVLIGARFRIRLTLWHTVMKACNYGRIDPMGL